MATNVAKLKQENLTNLTTRGSEKLLRAWKERGITEAAVREIADALDKSPAKVEGVTIVGGQNPTGVQLSLRYDGDDGPWCGNDILFWLKWHITHGSGGGVIHPPKVIINGIPWPEVVRLELGFGQTEPTPTQVGGLIETAGEAING